MDRFVNQFSEIGKLNAVMLHRPGDELNQVTPDFFDDMLIDDTLYLPAAQRDHDRFAEILRENGAAVYYLKDLFCEVIANDKLRLQYIEDFLTQSPIPGDAVRDAIRAYLCQNLQATCSMPWPAAYARATLLPFQATA